MQADKVPAAMRALKGKMHPAVTARDILRQAHRDLFDKEVEHTYTTSYVWMTNQVSHFGLGFLATFVIVWVVQIVHALCACGLTLTGIGVSCAIEPHHFGGLMLLVPVLEVGLWALLEYKDYAAAKQDAKGNSFVFDGRDVAYDALTALWFITAGMVVAYLSFVAWTLALAAFVVGAIVALLPAGYWLSRKLCFQQAALPVDLRDYGSRAHKSRRRHRDGAYVLRAQRPLPVVGEIRRNRADQPGGCRAGRDPGLAMASKRHCRPRRCRQGDRGSSPYVPGSHRCGSWRAASRRRNEPCGATDDLDAGPGSVRLDHQAICGAERCSTRILCGRGGGQTHLISRCC